MAEDLSKKGMEVRTALFGEKAARAGHEYLSEFDPGFADFLNDQVFGAVWGRPGLPLKTRSLITMAALLALGRAPELKIHMRGALNLGITRDEIRELIIHLSQYSGVPTAVEAMRVYREVTEPKK
ncbi:MAG TPA: carboxymuconolactone decarboxylase family protein [Candidatus Binataceae bacterium]|jgi:4-carboxymuconolactone decarboxylase|nr:carboxymuconolactone decarboxylase family protein [Candidatus Binataceae bacterium]